MTMTTPDLDFLLPPTPAIILPSAIGNELISTEHHISELNSSTTAVSHSSSLLNASLTASLPPADALHAALETIDAVNEAQLQLVRHLQPQPELQPPLITEQATTTASNSTSTNIMMTATLPSVSSVLNRALALANRATWIRDFLFADAPAVDLAMLTSPPALDAAITANVTENNMDMSGTGASLFDTSINVQWTLVPSFCSGDLVCGAASASMQITSSTTGKAPRELAYGRFVRDERTSEFILFRQHAPRGDHGFTCSLLHMSLANTTTRSRSFIQFSGPTTGSPPNASQAMFMNVNTENRMCPACSRGPSAACGCVLFGRTPAHPLDFDNCTTMANHCGNFSGVCESTIFHGPNAPISARMISRSAVRGGRDRQVTHALTGWAVRNKLTALGPSVAPTYTASTADEDRILEECARGERDFSCSSPIGAMPRKATIPLAPVSSFVQGAVLSCLPSSGTNTSLALPSSSSASNSEEEKAARKHRRKLRNRMAAARSNLKRKENYINLQRDVSEIRERKLQLTNRLSQLRSENERLRAQLEQ